MRKRQRKKNWKKKIVSFDQIPTSFLVSILKKKYALFKNMYSDIENHPRLANVPYFRAFDVQDCFERANEKDITAD